MAWNKLLHFIFSGTAMIAQPLMTPARPGLDEILAYECAKGVSDILSRKDQSGPLFYDSGLVFTSIEDSRGSPIIIVSSAVGMFSLPLESAGVNRIQFQLASDSYFMSYLHGTQTRSRVFDFGRGRPPAGRDETDYQRVQPTRAPELLAHLNYATYATSEEVRSALTNGTLLRGQIKRQRIQSCAPIAGQSPELARSLKRNMDVVEMMVHGPGRMPASAPAQ